MSIEIPRGLADAEGVPSDLDSSIGGSYRFPSPRRRRIAGWVYLGAGALIGLAAVLGLPVGLWGVAAALAVLAGYHFATAWRVVIDESDALGTAGRSVDFAVGHASAALRFEGWLSKPVWSVLAYSADDPPSRRALIRVDARTGKLRAEPYSEPIPSA